MTPPKPEEVTLEIQDSVIGVVSENETESNQDEE